MTLKLISDNTTTTDGTDEPTYYKYAVTYLRKDQTSADTIVVEGYPMVMGGFFSLVRLDAKKNSYTNFMVPVDSLIKMELVREETPTSA